MDILQEVVVSFLLVGHTGNEECLQNLIKSLIALNVIAIDPSINMVGFLKHVPFDTEIFAPMNIFNGLEVIKK